MNVLFKKNIQGSGLLGWLFSNFIIFPATVTVYLYCCIAGVPGTDPA